MIQDWLDAIKTGNGKDYSMGFGKGNQPIVMPRDHGKGPPIRGPEQPPGRWTEKRETIVKWGAIALVTLFLVLFVAVAVTGWGGEPTKADARATAEASAATREALQ